MHSRKQDRQEGRRPLRTTRPLPYKLRPGVVSSPGLQVLSSAPCFCSALWCLPGPIVLSSAASWRNRRLLLVIEHANRPIDVDVPVRFPVLIALKRPVFRFPFELGGIVGTKLPVQWCIVPLMLSRCVDARSPWLLVQVLRSKCSVTAAVVHRRFPSLLLSWRLLAETHRRGLRRVVAEPLA